MVGKVRDKIKGTVREAEKLNSKLSNNAETLSLIERGLGGIMGKMTSTLSQVGSIYKNQILGPIESISDSLNEMASVDLGNLTSYNRQLKEIVSTTKALIHEQIAWEQQLISTYKQIAEISQGSLQIYSTIVSTRKDISKSVFEWMKYGGAAEAANISIAFTSKSIADIDQLSNEVLLTWRKQNMVLGLQTESSAEIAAMQVRSGMTLKESLKYQRDIFATLKHQFKSNTLTSKMMEDIAKSNWSILQYTTGNVVKMAKIAGHAHSWGMEIDQIYEMTHKMAEAETAIEASRKAQLMFGIDLNAREMQYLAQMGKEEELASMLVDSFRQSNIEFDNMTLSQKQTVAEMLNANNVAHARMILLGREQELTEDLTNPIEIQTNLMREQNELLLAQTDTLAAYQTKYARERRMLWDTWGEKLDFIFGKQDDIRTAEAFSLELEKTRVNILKGAFTPLIENLNEKFTEMGMTNGLIGEGLKDNSSILGHLYQNFLMPISNIVSKIGGNIVEWWFKGLDGSVSAFERMKGILDYLNQPAVIHSISSAIVSVADAFLGILEGLSNPAAIETALDIFKGLGVALEVVGKTLAWFSRNYRFALGALISLALVQAAWSVAWIPVIGAGLAVGFLAAAGVSAIGGGLWQLGANIDTSSAADQNFKSPTTSINEINASTPNYDSGFTTNNNDKTDYKQAVKDGIQELMVDSRDQKGRRNARTQKGLPIIILQGA